MFESLGDAFERMQLYVKAGSVGFTRRSFFFAPLIVGAVSFWFLAFVAQFHEIYRDIVETLQFVTGLVGLAAITLFGGVLYAWHLTVSARAIDTLYQDHADPYLDKRLKRIRGLLSTASAALPLFGLLIGMMLSYPRDLAARLEDLAPALQRLPQYRQLTGVLARVQLGTALVVALTLLAVLMALFALHRLRNHWSLRRALLPVAETIAWVFLVSPLLLPKYDPEAIVVVAQALGPLAVSGLMLTAATMLLRRAMMLGSAMRSAAVEPLALLFFSSVMPSRTVRRRMIQAAVVTTSLLVALFLYLNLFAAPKRPEWHAPPGRSAGTEALTDDLRKWLDARLDRSEGQSYPVFVVAAQGGGIYAASAAATFLAKMEDICPGFSQHVFAISGVSGGAVGASIFNALMSRRRQVDRVACVDGAAEGNKAGALATDATRMILQDHLSPVLYTWLTDFVVGMAQLPLRPQSRVPLAGSRNIVLQKSFQRAFDAVAGPAGKVVEGCPPSRAPLALGAFYADHWCLASRAPALVLNSTWAENGYRVAFSPFGLRAVGDGTLFSFSEIAEIGAFGDCGLKTMTLVEAAIVSARFPAILPSWTLTCGSGQRNEAQPGRIRGTFVDGGYADNSGAATALELFNGLRRAAEALAKPGSPPAIDLRLVLLTDAPSTPEVADNARGWFGDSIAPLTTLLKVRELLARRAVTQAVNQLRQKADTVLVIQLDQETFPLTLGWKISDTTNDLVQIMLGTSGAAVGCEKPMNSAVEIICNNTANVATLKTLLAGRR